MKMLDWRLSIRCEARLDRGDRLCSLCEGSSRAGDPSREDAGGSLGELLELEYCLVCSLLSFVWLKIELRRLLYAASGNPFGESKFADDRLQYRHRCW